MSDVTINEKVSRATRSSHLKHETHPCSVDTIGALGMAGVDNKLSSIVFRLKYANEARFYPTALAVITAESKVLEKSLGWTGPAALFAAMNKACLDYWLNDRCMACMAKGYETILGTPYLSETPCKVCNGTTRVPPPEMPTEVWQDRFARLLRQIEKLERKAGGDVIAKLANEVREL